MENITVEYILYIGELPFDFLSAFSSDLESKILKASCVITQPSYLDVGLVVDGTDLKTNSMFFACDFEKVMGHPTQHLQNVNYNENVLTKF